MKHTVIYNDIEKRSYERSIRCVTRFNYCGWTKKLFEEKLVDQSSVKDIAKLAAGITGAAMLVKYAQSKKWIPDDPFKA